LRGQDQEKKRTGEIARQETRGRVRVIRDADYTAVRENGSISARTATNGVNSYFATSYKPTA
jgi:hypothetical protein